MYKLTWISILIKKIELKGAATGQYKFGITIIFIFKKYFYIQKLIFLYIYIFIILMF
jgi:hypothetical protein